MGGIETLLSEARKHGVTIEVVGDSLRVEGPNSQAELVRQILSRKSEVIRSINGEPPPAATPPTPWRPFPIDLLPDPLREYVSRSAAAIGCDSAFVATAILPALASAIGTTRAIILKSGWVEPAVLWGVAVGDSGSQKSPAIDAATKHIRRRQAESTERYQAAREEYDQEVEQYNLAYDDWKRSGRKKGELPPEEPIEPAYERSYCSDVTVEGLAPILAGTPRGLLLCRDELSGWIGGFDQYKSGRGGADTAHWLAMHGARDLVIDRKTGNQRTLFVKRAAVSVLGGIQPSILGRVLGNEHFENGLAARLLLAFPPRRTKRWTETKIDENLDRRVGELFDRLFELQPDDDGEPILLGMTRSGKAAWIEFYNEHAKRIADATGDDAALLSKIEGAAARLALVIHVVRQAAFDADAGQSVDERSIRTGIAIAEWFAAESMRIYEVLAEGDMDREQRELVELISRRGGSITARDLMRATRRIATSEAAESFLASLVKKGLGTWEHSQPGDSGGRPAAVFRLSNTVDADTTPKNPEKSEVVSTEHPHDSASERSSTGGNGSPKKTTGFTDVDGTSRNSGKSEVVSASTLDGVEFEEFTI